MFLGFNNLLIGWLYSNDYYFKQAMYTEVMALAYK